MSGWSSIARNIIGSPKIWVIRSSSISASSRPASKPRMMNSAAPTMTAAVQWQLSCAVWNIGIIAANRSVSLNRASTATDRDSR